MSKDSLLSLYGDYASADGDGSLARLAGTLAAGPFGGIDVPFEFTFLRSTRRESRQASLDGRGVVIIDLGQAAVLATGAELMRCPTAAVSHGVSFGNLLFSDAFARFGRSDRALVCSTAFAGDGDLVRACHERTSLNGAQLGATAYLICHELAHFAVDARHALARPYVEAATEALERHCVENLRFSVGLSQGVELPPDVESSVTRGPEEARQLMARQIAEHVALVRRDPEVVREACCDVLSVVALLSWRSGLPLERVTTSPMSLLALREVGDVLMLGHASSRMLMLHECARLTARHVSLGEGPEGLGREFARMTARHNVGTNMYLALFELVSSNLDPDGVQGGRTPHDAVRALRRAIEVVNARSADLLFSGVEQIGLLHRDEAAFEKAHEAALEALSMPHDPDEDALEMALEACAATFPF